MITILFIILKVSDLLFIGWEWIIFGLIIDIILISCFKNEQSMKKEIYELRNKVSYLKK